MDQAISVDEFKERNTSIMKNRWIDTQQGSSGEKIYKLYNPEQEGELVKEALQEWLCDNRNEIMQCIGIALRNHEKSYAEWFRYVDSRSGLDELALYGLSRKYGIHTAIFNRSYVWTTLADHILRSDEEIISICGVNLVFLDQTTYGIIKNIRIPNPDENVHTTPTVSMLHKKPSKKTCRDSTQGKNTKKQVEQKQNTAHGKRSRTLSESRRETFGISASPTATRNVRSSRQNIDYLTLNDGLDDDTLSSPKCRKKSTYRPRSGPSATRQAVQKHTASPESKTLPKTGGASTLPAALTTMTKKSATELSGVPDNQILPDLVLDREEETTHAAEAISTEEEMDAAAALLSLGEIRDDTPDDDNENAKLMPIGGQNVPIDAAPEPYILIKLVWTMPSQKCYDQKNRIKTHLPPTQKCLPLNWIKLKMQLNLWMLPWKRKLNTQKKLQTKQNRQLKEP